MKNNIPTLEHTPGPWTSNESLSSVTHIYPADTPYLIAGISMQYRPRNVSEANVRLILSAPDLLEASINLLAEIRRSTDFDTVDLNLIESAVSKMEATIKKATTP